MRSQKPLLPSTFNSASTSNATTGALPLRAMLLALTLVAGAPSSFAQGAELESPGMQRKRPAAGQTTRFSTEFNPAIGFALDAFADWADVDEGDDGFDLSVRLLEFNAAAYVDPALWAYVAIVAEDLEEVAVEEAAAEYIGFEGASTIRAGRFFVDFGKQMQSHLEELRTLERPLVLRDYLGEELSGDGVQYDNWFPAGDTTAVRFSVGVFASLLGEDHAREDEDEDESAPELAAPDRKDFDELSFSARVTGMRDIGASGVLQLGASARYVPEFEASFGPLVAEELSNAVYGIDATYGFAAEDSGRGLVVGGEALLFDGDLAAAVDDPLAPAVLSVVDDDVFGGYAFADYRWNSQDSAGAQYSRIEEPEDPSADASEVDFYWTHHFTEFRRLRFGTTLGNGVEDDARVYVQFTSFFGSHAHGVNW